MHRNFFLAFPACQRGAALIILMFIGMIAAISFLLNRVASRSTVTDNQATMQRLALAKEALIGWSASHSTTPGMLPCPEDTTRIGTSTEGQALSNCGNLLQVGRLPWRTLKLPQLRDDAGEPLWYALSPGFRSFPTPFPINANNLGQLTIDGTPNSAVAIIFSPGAPLSGQNRLQPAPIPPPDASQYLDATNGTGPFVTAGALGLFNDRLEIITRDDLFGAVNRRILGELKGDDSTGLGKYYKDNGNKYPSVSVDLQTELTPLLVTATNKTLTDNNWYPLITYSVSASLLQATLTINTPTPVSCTITPGQMLCPYP